jgi:hypothetical protein
LTRSNFELFFGKFSCCYLSTLIITKLCLPRELPKLRLIENAGVEVLGAALLGVVLVSMDVIAAHAPSNAAPFDDLHGTVPIGYLLLRRLLLNQSA